MSSDSVTITRFALEQMIQEAFAAGIKVGSAGIKVGFEKGVEWGRRYPDGAPGINLSNFVGESDNEGAA